MPRKRREPVEKPGDTNESSSSMIELPNDFLDAVGELVVSSRSAIQMNTTMFKVQLKNVPVGSSPAEIIESMQNRAESDICVVKPLALVTRQSLPSNGCSRHYNSFDYAHALAQAVRNHFAFVEFDHRLIYTKADLVYEKNSALLVYLYIYLKTPAEQKEPVIEAETTVMLTNDNDEPGPSRSSNRVSTAVRNVVETTLNKLSETEKKLLDETERMEVDVDITQIQLPEMRLHTPNISLDRGKKRKSVLETVQLRMRDEEGNGEKMVPSQSPKGRKRVMDTARERLLEESKRKRDRSGDHSSSIQPTLCNPPEVEPEVKRSRKSTSSHSDLHNKSFLEFYYALNASQSERTRVALTCRYARLRYDVDISPEKMYHLIESQDFHYQKFSENDYNLDEKQYKDRALQIYNKLHPDQTVQARVAFALRYMQVNHKVKISSKQMYDWLEPPKKRGKNER